MFTLVNEKIAQVEEILKTKKAKLAGLAPVLKTAQLVYQVSDMFRIIRADDSTSSVISPIRAER